MPTNTLVIHAHPRAGQSVAIESMRQTLAAQADVTVRALYELYPDFDIDIAAEQDALRDADLVIWLAPVHWYSVPALLKQWFDEVLAYGWAYGHGAKALEGKSVWWVTSTGGDRASYAIEGAHARPFNEYVAPIEQTGRYCGMHWLDPFVAHAGHGANESALLDTQAKLLHALALHHQSTGRNKRDPS